MAVSFFHICVALTGLIVDMGSQFFIFRMFQTWIGLLKSEYMGVFLGFLSVIFLEFYIFAMGLSGSADFIALSITDLIIYFCLAFCYFTFVNLGETARRVRILRELYDAEDGLSMEEILKCYNAKMIIEKRLQRLLNNRQILLKDGRYYIGSPVMLWMAKVIVLMKLITLGKRSEFN